jgi:uncharacterized metal-binding protein
VLKLIWLGYHRAFNHRGKSHSLIFASFTKVAYLALITSFLISLIIFIVHLYQGLQFQEAVKSTIEQVSVVFEKVHLQLDTKKEYFISGICGLILSDWIHIIADKIVTLSKKILH